MSCVAKGLKSAQLLQYDAQCSLNGPELRELLFYSAGRMTKVSHNSKADRITPAASESMTWRGTSVLLLKVS